MSEQVTFAFKSFQAVRIKAIETKGFVCSRMNNQNDANEYKVIYWIDGDRKDGWFYEFELEPA